MLCAVFSFAFLNKNVTKWYSKNKNENINRKSQPPFYSSHINMEQKHREFLEENTPHNGTIDDEDEFLESQDGKDTFDYWAPTRQHGNSTIKTRPTNATTTSAAPTVPAKKKINNIFNYIYNYTKYSNKKNKDTFKNTSNNTSTRHLLKHLLRKLNSTSTFSSQLPPLSPLYDFLLGNFKLSNEKKSLAGSNPRVNVSTLTRRQLMTLQLNKTLMDMASDFVRKPPIANSFSFNGGKLTFNGEERKSGTSGRGRGRGPLVNSTARARNDTDVRFVIPLVSGENEEDREYDVLMSTVTKNSIDKSRNDSGRTSSTNNNQKIKNKSWVTNNSYNDSNSNASTREFSTNNKTQPTGSSKISQSSRTSRLTNENTTSEQEENAILTTPLPNTSPSHTVNNTKYNNNDVNNDDNNSNDDDDYDSLYYQSRDGPRNSPTSPPNHRTNPPETTKTTKTTATTTTTTSKYNSSPDYISDAIDSTPDSQYLTNIRVNENCMRSKTFYNVTLRGGYDSGKFRDRGRMGGVGECARLCCQLNKCDLVMMLQDRCFSVHCKSPRLCESIPARSPVFSPTVCYVRHG